ncbi:hypothetical protein CC656_000456 [Salmonella enterica subsp. enterica]|nr:hypothetical protein [Salmonella enterica subsp. enterica]EIL4074348.1 hypothetical protein [Salmonella enterica]ECI7957019.1 hypothetical protein [Salmonella enterica subsp. enterica]ECJ5065652.1 hypothetical protein [Salmonella enterica subsp. enterica]EDT8008635.1 hypothetical protein [Salmonella enterica subsp. enterica]
MANIARHQLLINPYYNVSPEMAREVIIAADDAESSISLGIAAIGELMFWVTENPEYDPETMSNHMCNIGLLLRCMSNMQIAITGAKENCMYTINEAGVNHD